MTEKKLEKMKGNSSPPSTSDVRKSPTSTLDHPIERLFNIDRLPGETFKLILLLIYAPVGALVFLLRLAVGLNAFAASCILPKTAKWRCYLLRGMSMLCGVIVRESGVPQDKQCTVVVSNHVSPLDHAAVTLLRPCLVPNVWNLPSLLAWAFGYTAMGAQSGRQTLVDNAKLYCQKSNSVPLLALPETAMTNGRTSLLSFANWPFSLDADVQPCVIHVRRPMIADISVTRLGSRWWTDLLWFLFVPYTIISVKWLPRLQVDDAPSNEASGDNAMASATRRAQHCAKLIAAELHIATSRYTSRDAVEYAKRVVLDRRLDGVRERENRQQRVQAQAARREAANVLSNARSKPRSDAELDVMTFKVKELCPTVPLFSIREDIERTRSVALTAERFSSDDTTFTAITSSEDVPRVYKLLNRPIGGGGKAFGVQFALRKWHTIEQQRMMYRARRGGEQ